MATKNLCKFHEYGYYKYEDESRNLLVNERYEIKVCLQSRLNQITTERLSVSNNSL